MRSSHLAPWAVLALLTGAACEPDPAPPIGIPCEAVAPLEPGVSFDPDTLLCVQVRMHPDDFAELAGQYRFGETSDDQWPGIIAATAMSCTEPYPDPFTWFPADATIDGQEVRDVGVRKKGFLGSLLGAEDRPSLKLDLDEFIDDQELGGTDTVVLNNNHQDPSRLRTCLAYSVFADAGYPAPRCNLANVSVNGAALGTYTHVEGVKGDFLRAQFGNDDGSLYEGTVADFTDAHLADLPYGLGRFDPKTDETDASGAPLARVAEALKAPDDELEQALDAVIDLDAFVRFWALESLIAHGDGYTQNTNNFYVYFDPARGGRAVFLPWGADEAFWGDEPEMVTSELTRRLSRHPELSARYRAELQRLVDEVWDEDVLLDRIDRWSALVATAEDDLEWHRWSVGHLRDFVRDRPEVIDRFLAHDGVKGGPDTRTCTGDRDVEDFVLLGEFTTVASLGCATAPTGPGPGPLVAAALAALGARRRGARRHAAR